MLLNLSSILGAQILDQPEPMVCLSTDWPRAVTTQSSRTPWLRPLRSRLLPSEICHSNLRMCMHRSLRQSFARAHNNRQHKAMFKCKSLHQQSLQLLPLEP